MKQLTYLLINLISQIFSNLERKVKKQRTYQEVVFFFQSKCFLFFRSVYQWLLQHNISTAKYSIRYLSVLGDIQSLLKHLKWTFLRKMFASADSKKLLTI